MIFLKRLPIYASGVGLTVALVVVADSRDWSGWDTLGAALAVGAFYVVAILVPLVLREQVSTTAAAAAADHAPRANGNGNHFSLRLSVDEHNLTVLVVSEPDRRALRAPTRGPVAVAHSD